MASDAEFISNSEWWAKKIEPVDPRGAADINRLCKLARRGLELEKVVDSAHSSLMMAKDPSCDQSAWFDLAVGELESATDTSGGGDDAD